MEGTETEVKIVYDEEGRKILNNYKFLSLIGRGSYAKVKLCQNVKDGVFYAVKIFNKNILGKKKKAYSRDEEGNMSFTYMLEDALNEIKVLKLLNANGGNDKIVKLYEVIEDTQNGKVYLILEYCEYGSIMSYDDYSGVFSINKHYKDNSYSEEELKGFLRNLAEGLHYTHSRNVVHRDIKTDNILLYANGLCKLSDFSIASVIEGEDLFTKTEGNMYFYPPEFCNDSKRQFSGRKVDIWALGVTIYIAAYKSLPFMPNPPSNMIELFSLIEKAEVSFPKGYSPQFEGFLKRLLERDPVKRLTAKEILEDSYLNN